MSTQSPTNGLLNVLSSLNGEIQLGVTIGGVVIPLIVGVVKSIKSALSGGTTITYTIELQTEQDILDAVIATGAADLAAINAELTRLGRPTLAVPTAPVATPIPPAAPIDPLSPTKPSNS